MKYIMVVLKLIVPFRFKINQRLPLLFAFLLVAGVLNAATITTTGSGNWSSTVADAPWPLGVLPQPGDDVIVGSGFTLTVDAPFTCNSITAGVGSTIINNSNLTVTTNLLGSGALNQGSGAILSIGGLSTITTLTATTNPNTVNYTGAAQTIKATTYHDLNTSGSGVKSVGVITVNGALSVGSGTNFSVSNAGAKLFVGLVTINSGATWTNTTRAVSFRGGITNNGTFNGGTTAVYTFNTNSQALTGNFTIPNVTVNGGAVVLTNTNSLTVNNVLTGTGRITQGTGATLNITGSSTITSMDASTNANTVNYNGAAQTVKNVAYHNLFLSGSGIKTLQVGTTSIAGNLDISGTAIVTAFIGLTIGGDVEIRSGTSFTAGAFVHNVGGNWTKNASGTFVGTGSTINFNRSGDQTISDATIANGFNEVILAGSGTKIFAASTRITGTLSINTGVKADLGAITSHTADKLILGGVIQPVIGIWGGTASSSPPASTNDTFFVSTSTGEISIASGAYSYYSRASGDWNSASTWSTVGFGSSTNTGTFPASGDFVFIGGGKTVTVTAAAACNVLSFDAGTSVNNTLTINSSNTLAVSGAITIPQTVTSGSNTLDVGAGTLTASAIDFTATGSGAGHQMTISTGTATVSGNVTGIGASSTISFSGAGLLRLGGAFFTASNGTLSAGTGTVEYNGSANQTVEAHVYRNLILSGSLNKTMGNSFTMTGDLTVNNNATFVVPGFQLVVTGTTNVASGGTLSITNNANTKTFIGGVTIASGGAWTNPGNEAVTFQNGIVNNGLVTAFSAGSGVHTFNTNAQSLTGPFSIPSVTVTGVVLTNNGTLTVGSALSGTGGITQGATATLNIGGTSAITSMIATDGTNTVNYTGAAQTVKSVNYVNLGLSGSGIKTLQVGTTAITGDLILSSATTLSTTGVIGLTIGDDVNIGANTTFIAGSFVHNVGGDWINNGTFTGTGSTINFNGAGQTISGATTTFNDVILAGTGTKVFGVSTTMVGGLSIINTGIKADLGIITTHSANTLTLGGALQPFSSTTWGSSMSGAAHTDDSFFLSTSSGRVNIALGGNNYYSVADGLWSSTSTWSTVGFGGAAGAGPPGPNDFVFIGTNGGGSRTVTVDVAAECSALSFDAGTATSLLTINPTFSLTVSGAVTIPRGVSGSNTLAVATGTLTAGDIDFTTPSNSGVQQLTISTGTATVSGNVTGVGASSTISFSGAGFLNVAGSMFASGSGTLTAGSGTVAYTGSAQTVQALPYNNLTLSGSGTKTLAAATTIGGILNVGSGTTFTVGAMNFTVTGSTTVDGTLSITSNTGTKTFTGNVDVNGTWTNTTEGVTFRGGIDSPGTFTAGTGVHTFDTNAQILTGTLSIPSVTITGVVLTNNGTLTVSTALTGGAITQGTSAILNIGGTSTSTLTATAGTNTVNYTGAAQSVNSGNYVNLGLSGSGAKTLAGGTTAITGNFTLSGTASAAGVVGLSIGGNVTIGAGTTFTAGAFTHSVAGNWINNGTFNHSNGTISFNGGAVARSISGTTNAIFNDMVVSNTAGFTISSPQRLNGRLTFGAGSVFNANGNLTLLSTAVNHAASIGDLTGITFNGNVTVQRFFGVADNVDRFISSPVFGATVAQLQASTPIGSFPVTGGFTGTSFPCTGCDLDGHNLRYYREAETGAITSGYKSWVTSTSSTLVPGVGYDAYMWNGVSNTTVSFTGSINKGDIELGKVSGTPPNSTSITFTDTNDDTADGWNLVGNPYPSAILWDNSVAAGWTRTNINDYVYVYDVAGASWRYKDFSSGTGNLPGGLIASGQGFWVYTSSPTATLIVKEAAKSSSTTTSYYRASSNPVDRLKISLRSSEGPSTDDIFLMSGSSNTNAKNGFKPELGFEPIAMSFLVGDVKYGFYVRKNETQSIPVYVKIKNEGSYEFSFSSEGNEGEFENYYLVDTYLGKYEKVISGASYSFDFTVAQANLASSRFYLTTNPDQLLEGKENVVHVACFPNPTAGDLRIEINSEDVQDVSVINSTGTRIHDTIDLKKSNGITSGKVDLNNVSPGIYMIRGYSKGRVFTEKVIKY